MLQAKAAAEKTGNRVAYFDNLKFWAILVVSLQHFIGQFNVGYSSFWYTPPTSWFLMGITGKMAVALFAVIAGYFSTRSGRAEKPAGKYIMARYLYFFLCGLFINVVYAAAIRVGALTSDTYVWAIPETVSVGQIMEQSMRLRDGIYSCIWFLKDFFWGSVFCFACGYMKIPGVGILLLIAALRFNNLWMAIYLMGGIVVWLESCPCVCRALEKWWLRAALLLAAFFAIQRQESDTTFFIDGIFSVILILALQHSTWLRRILSLKWVARIGRNSMAILLIHPSLYVFLGPGCFACLAALPYRYAFLLTWAICFAVVVALSFPLTAALDRGSRLAAELLQTLYEKAGALFRRLPQGDAGQ